MAILIVVETPTGTKPPPSFLSDKLNTDLAKIELKDIRRECRISKKHAFSINGINPISNDLKLQQYIDLTPDNSKAIKDVQEGQTATIVIKVISLNNSPENQKNHDQSKLQDDLKKLLDRRGKGVEGGDHADASKLLGELHALKESYAVKASKIAYTEAADLTETQWENILFNNRMLHGYYYHPDKSVLIKAPKRAFAIRRPTEFNGPEDAELAMAVASDDDEDNGNNSENGKKENSKDGKEMKEYLNTLPGIPCFYVEDDSKVNVVELQNAFQRRMVEQGFSYKAIEANAAGKPFGNDFSFSENWSEEESYQRDKITSKTDSTLAVCYNFPRVVVDLSPKYLQLSDECYEDIMNLTEETKAQFERNYGNAFPTCLVLGGSLNSTRTVTSESNSELEAHKTETKDAAGINFAAPRFSVGLTQAHSDSKEDNKKVSTAKQFAHLTWEARGGDTVLCSNPPEWATTVKDYRFWRVINQSHVVHLNKMVSHIDPVIARQLEYPGIEIEDKLVEDLSDIVDGETTAERYKRLVSLFNSQKDFTNFNSWLKKRGDQSLVIKEGQKWKDLKGAIARDQKIMFGLWLFYVRKIDVTSGKR